MTDNGHWNFPSIIDTSMWFGFIYRITELDTGREYVGKKNFRSMRRVTVKGRKNKKITYKDSDWKSYTGSSKELNEQISLKGMSNYKFDILSLHETKGSLYYAEVRLQVMENVLREKMGSGIKKYFNKNIASVKFIPPDDTDNEQKFQNRGF